MPGLIKIGVTSWTEPTLVKSGWYPKGVSTAEARLRYYASQFTIVENDSTYYAIPDAERARLWVERTPAGFTMNVKAFATMTGHYTDPHRLPADLKGALPAEVLEKRRVYPKDLGDELVAELASRFQAAIEPLREAGRLGVVLFQYPVWFPSTPDNQAAVVATRAMCPDTRIAIEFRNATWMNDRHRERTLAMLRDAELVYTCVDEPQGFPSSVPPITAATSDIALVRFHGRSASRWTRATKSATERFRYRYSERELAEWTRPIAALADQAHEVHVLMNNCYSSFSVTNARQLIELFEADEGLRPRLAVAS